jgi:hypothetical protein
VAGCGLYSALFWRILQQLAKRSHCRGLVVFGNVSFTSLSVPFVSCFL